MSDRALLNVTYMLRAQDPERAKRFYADAFGAKVVWSADDGSWTVLDIGGREVCLHGSGSGEVTDTGLAISVDDLDGACAAIARAGGHVLRPGPSGEQTDDVGRWLAIVTDTEGNRFCVAKQYGCFLHPSLFPAATAAR